MASRERLQTTSHRIQAPASLRTAARRASEAAPRGIGLSVYGCDPDEAVAFHEVARRFGVTATITDAAVSETNAELAIGNRCISVGHKTPVSNATLLALSEAGVSYVSTRSAGSNHLDSDFARRVGITVEGVAYSPGSVADYTLMLILMAVRNARSIVLSVEAHDFRLQQERGRELRDLTVGVVGTGRIGAAVIDRLNGFGCRVLAFDRKPKTFAHYVPLDELLEQSDIVTLHTPLTAQTEHLLDRHRLARMKPGAYLVNTGRGPIIDTLALVEALEGGRLGGAAVDVLEGEDGLFYTDRRDRPIENELFLRLQRLPNALITPHTAYYTDRALYDTVTNTIRNCLDFEGRQNA